MVLRVGSAALLDRLEAPLEGRSRMLRTRWDCKGEWRGVEGREVVRGVTTIIMTYDEHGYAIRNIDCVVGDRVAAVGISS